MILEDITKNQSINFEIFLNKQFHLISGFIINEDLGALLLVESYNTLIQYDISGGGQMGKVIKNYGKLDIGNIFSLEKFGNLVVLGGDFSRIDFIDLKKRRKLNITLLTGVRIINCLSIFTNNQTKVILSIWGQVPENPNGKSNLFDITSLVEIT